jgi:hypothetical protein
MEKNGGSKEDYMATDDCPKAARCVAKLLICIGSVFIAICALTQVVGVNLGALVFVAMAIIWPARAVLRCENWGRIGYLMAGPFAVWMSLQALRDAEFFQDFLYLLMLITGIVYLATLVVLTRSRIKQSFLRQTTPAEKGSFGKGFSVLLISFSGFLFAWWWTNLSTVLHLISVADFQGILICLVGISIAIALGALGLRVWWSRYWRMVSGFILLATGLVLLEHALCYSAITALVYLGGSESAFGDTGLIIGGRFLFAVFALAGGVIFVRVHKQMAAGLNIHLEKEE